MKILMKITETSYRSGDGHTMSREYGKTPNGYNDLGGMWVLRAPDGSWIDYDKYSSDLAESYGFQFATDFIRG